MRIHLLSDLHNEISLYSPATTSADVVILAGDIDIGRRGIDWAKENFSCPCLYVAGNHEYYKGHLANTLKKMRSAADDRVRFLDCDEAIIDGVRFLGATGWTDYTATGNMPLAKWDALQTMRDFRKIRTESNYRKTTPDDYANISTHVKSWLSGKLLEPFDGKTVVITHHAPSTLSLMHAEMAGSHLSAAYANRWEGLMGEGLDLWLHGHSHTAVDYMIDKTRIVSNPRGYPGEWTGFDEALILEI